MVRWLVFVVLVIAIGRTIRNAAVDSVGKAPVFGAIDAAVAFLEIGVLSSLGQAVSDNWAFSQRAYSYALSRLSWSLAL